MNNGRGLGCTRMISIPNNSGGDGDALVKLYFTHHEPATRCIFQRRGIQLDGSGAVRKERGVTVRGRRMVRDFSTPPKPILGLVSEVGAGG